MIQNLQKHIEVDEPEEDMQDFDVPSVLGAGAETEAEGLVLPDALAMGGAEGEAASDDPQEAAGTEEDPGVAPADDSAEMPAGAVFTDVADPSDPEDEA